LLSPNTEWRWGIGHHKHQQLSFQGKPHWQFRYNHGGILRQKRRGRKARPLSTREPIHLVFKADNKSYKRGLRSPLGFAISQRILKKYAKRFFVKLEQVAICQDHIHCLVRFSKRSLGQHFFRVVAGQIAQEFQKNGLIKVTDTPAERFPIAKVGSGAFLSGVGTALAGVKRRTHKKENSLILRQASQSPVKRKSSPKFLWGMVICFIRSHTRIMGLAIAFLVFEVLTLKE